MKERLFKKIVNLLINLTPEVLEGLKGKHPEAADIADESLLYRPIDYIPPGVFDLIDEKMIFDAAKKKKKKKGLGQAFGDGC